jgi:hypothetical protein
MMRDQTSYIRGYVRSAVKRERVSIQFPQRQVPVHVKKNGKYFAVRADLPEHKSRSTSGLPVNSYLEVSSAEVPKNKGVLAKIGFKFLGTAELRSS